MTSNKAYNSAVGYVYTWKMLMDTYCGMNIQKEAIYYGFSEGFLKLVINLYYSSFDKNEKKKFKKIRQELLEIVKLKKGRTSKSIRLFFINPVIYKVYKNIVNLIK